MKDWVALLLTHITLFSGMIKPVILDFPYNLPFIQKVVCKSPTTVLKHHSAVVHWFHFCWYMKLPWSVEGQLYITEGQKYFLTLFQISCATLETAYISNPPPLSRKRFNKWMVVLAFNQLDTAHLNTMISHLNPLTPKIRCEFSPLVIDFLENQSQ